MGGGPAGLTAAIYLTRFLRSVVVVDGFTIRAGDLRVTSRAVLFAAGTTNHRPPGLDAAAHDDAVAAGLLRHCAVCDGFEARGRRIAVLGSDEHGAAEAKFLRPYSAAITLLPAHLADLGAEERTALVDAGIAVVEAKVDRLTLAMVRSTPAFLITIS